MNEGSTVSEEASTCILVACDLPSSQLTILKFVVGLELGLYCSLAQLIKKTLGHQQTPPATELPYAISYIDMSALYDFLLVSNSDIWPNSAITLYDIYNVFKSD